MKNLSIEEIEKFIKSENKRAKKLSDQSMNSMSGNAQRNTKKATAEHGSQMAYKNAMNAESYLNARRMQESQSTNFGKSEKDINQIKEKINQQSGNSFETTREEDWGKQQSGKRIGQGQVMGGMSNAPTGKKQYTDPLGTLKETELENYNEANELFLDNEIYKKEYAKARESGLDHNQAYSYVSYRIGDISEKEFLDSLK